MNRCGKSKCLTDGGRGWALSFAIKYSGALGFVFVAFAGRTRSPSVIRSAESFKEEQLKRNLSCFFFICGSDCIIFFCIDSILCVCVKINYIDF